MRWRGVKRSKARGQGVGRWLHRYVKYADSLSTPEFKGSVFKFFYPETWFQKSVFTGTMFTGSMWTIDQNDAKHVRLHTQKRFHVDGVIVSCQMTSTPSSFIDLLQKNAYRRLHGGCCFSIQYACSFFLLYSNETVKCCMRLKIDNMQNQTFFSVARYLPLFWQFPSLVHQS